MVGRGKGKKKIVRAEEGGSRTVLDVGGPEDCAGGGLTKADALEAKGEERTLLDSTWGGLVRRVCMRSTAACTRTDSSTLTRQLTALAPSGQCKAEGTTLAKVLGRKAMRSRTCRWIDCGINNPENEMSVNQCCCGYCGFD